MDQEELIKYMEKEMNPAQLWNIALAGATIQDAQHRIIDNNGGDFMITMYDVFTAATKIVQGRLWSGREL